MICPYCHKETPDSSTFCTECGRRLREAASEEPVTPGSDGARADRPIESAEPTPDDGHAVEAGETDESGNRDAAAKAGAPVQPGATAANEQKAAGSQAGDSTDGLAVASLVCSIVGIFFLQFLLPILGIIFGAVARGRNPKDSTNGKLALAGLIVGIIVLVLTILVFIAILVLGFTVGSEAYGLAHI